MTTYSNFTSKPYRKAAERALKFVFQYISPTKEKEISRTILNKNLGRSNDPIGNFLRENLLVVSNDHYLCGKFGTQCKKYLRNESGIKIVMQTLNTTKEDITKSIFVDLDAMYDYQVRTGEWQYENKSYRNYHEVQNIRKDIRKEWLKHRGYERHFDIAAAAPSIILSYAKNRCSKKKKFTYLEEYLSRPDEYRQEIANYSGLTTDQAKEVVNALLNGAKMTMPNGHVTSCTIYDICGKNVNIFNALSKDPLLKALRKDFSKCWSIINKDKMLMDEIAKELLGDFKSPGKRKAAVYRKLEQQVMGAITDYLKVTHNKCFTIHDGFACVRDILIEELEEIIFEATQFKVSIVEDK